jgi:putative hydrolase of HD superfamily
VAFLVYGCIADRETSLGSKDMWKRYHAFFGAMFHDLPEVLTRDIISPVKGIDGGIIGGIVNEIEKEWFKKTFEPILPKRLYHELSFFALEEFKMKKWPPNNWPTYLQDLDKGRVGTRHPGPVVESCDKFAGFMEAFFSVSFGISSPNLLSALFPNKEGLEKRKELNSRVPQFRGLYEEYTKIIQKKGITG